MNADRDNQHGEVMEQVRAIEDELMNLADELRKRGDREIIIREERPPVVPSKDVAVSPRPSPMGPRGDSRQAMRSAHLMPISLTPPPQQLASPSSLTSTMSFLSSHHSDDSTLYRYQDTEPKSDEHRHYMDESRSASPEIHSPTRSASPTPSWPDSSSSDGDDTSSFVSSSLSSYPITSPPQQSLDPISSSTSSGDYLSQTSADALSRVHTPLQVPSSMQSSRPSVSPTPSSSSVSTVRASPPEPETAMLSNLRGLLEGLREQTDALRQGQESTNEALDELRGRAFDDKFHRLEDMLQHVLDRSGAPIPPPSAEMDTADETASEASSGRLRNRLEELMQRRREPPIIHQPTPRTPGRHDDLLRDMFAPQMPIPQTVGQPPQLKPFTYQPIPRPPRSVSPSADLPRAPTVPILPSETRIHYRPAPAAARPQARSRSRPAARRRTRTDSRSRAGLTPSEPADVELETEPPTRPVTTVTDTGGPSYLDQVRRKRQERQGRGDGFYGSVPVSHFSTRLR